MLGFDDYLASFGRPDVGEQIGRLGGQAEQSSRVQSAQDSLQEQIEVMDVTACQNTTVENRQVPVCALHADIRLLSMKLKTDFLSALMALKAPTRAEGDND